MKAYNIEMVRYLCHHPAEVERYWNSIKIAKRAGCKFNEPSIWFDYIKMLGRMGKDINSPSLIAPKDIETAHDIYVEKLNRQRAKERMLADRKRAEEEKPHLRNSKDDTLDWQ